MKLSFPRFLRLASSAALLSVIVAAAACTEEPKYSFTIERKSVNGLPTMTSNESLSGEAKVIAVDYTNNSIALAGPKGDSNIFRVSKAARNFNQIKTGDTVKVEYVSQMKVSVHKTDVPLSVTQTLALETPPLGDKPGIVGVRTIESLCNVTAIDYTTRTVTLQRTDGSKTTLTASRELPDFDNVKVGDQVVFAYTESVTISVKE